MFRIENGAPGATVWPWIFEGENFNGESSPALTVKVFEHPCRWIVFSNK
jgi:hypothetical protein